MEPVREDCIEGDLEVARLHVLVSMSREKLRKAKEDIERLQNTQYEVGVVQTQVPGWVTGCSVLITHHTVYLCFNLILRFN